VTFDFEHHRLSAEARYRSIRPVYENFVKRLHGLLSDLLIDVSVHEIQCRAKTVSSFGMKACKIAPKTDDSEPDVPKYPDPFATSGGITDFAGVRIITYLPNVIEDVKRVIEAEFTRLEPWEDKGEKLTEVGRIGYKSIHSLVRLSETRRGLKEFSQYKDFAVEIQIRTILQHAWAEMEHDIRYKSVEDVPRIVSARFTALAGLIEIADREFQAIQDYDRQLKEQVAQTSQLREEGTLIKVPAPQGTDEKTFVLAQPEPSVQSMKLSEGQESPKRLLAEGRFADAVSRYSELIQQEPTQFSHFLGRARAHFLNGDRAGALRDIAAAEGIAGNPSHVESLRRQIEDGSLDSAITTYTRKGAEEASLGHIELANDDGEAAFRHFNASEEEGYNALYVNFNKAMACCAEEEYRGCRNYLSYIDPFPGTYLEFNCAVLRFVSLVLEGQRPDVTVKEIGVLKRGLEESKHPYSVQQSPLRYLFQALLKREDESIATKLAALLKVLDLAQ
jgi:ppGpp synthetase/RelA/SpoT-type nucleotidyltranferase